MTHSSGRPRIALLFVVTVIVSSALPTDGVAQRVRPEIQATIDEIRIDSLASYLTFLTGQRPVHVSDSVFQLDTQSWIADTFVTLRDRYMVHNDVATYYLEKKLQSFGYHPVVERACPPIGECSYSQSVLALHVGSKYPQTKLILCAHYDSVQDSPGADDNGSGTAAVLEAARVLSGLTTDYSILFAFWDSEEVWTGSLPGSRYYAEKASAEGEDIRAVVNLDMIAWDGDRDRVFEIDTDARSLWLAEEIRDFARESGFGLNPLIYNPGVGRSDHYHFQQNGFSAVMLIEELHGDFNPTYHSPDDITANLNWDYYYEMVRMATAYIAVRSVVSETGVWVTDAAARVNLERPVVYPVPIRDRGTLSLRIGAATFGRIDIYDVWGRTVQSPITRRLEAGLNRIGFDAQSLAPGVYLYRVTAGRETATGTLVVVR